jgi:hypothetical protein
LSDSDERTPVEERVALLESEFAGHHDEGGLTVEKNLGSLIRLRSKCGWCGSPIGVHSPAQRNRCEAAYEAEIDRRRAGPTRVADVTRRPA